MAAVTIIWDGVTDPDIKDHWDAIATDLGHTTNVILDSALTGTSENGQDLIIVCPLSAVDYAGIQSDLTDYFDGTGAATSPIPVIIGMMTGVGATATSTSPASYLGFMSSVIQAFGAGGQSPSSRDEDELRLGSDWRDSPITQAFGTTQNLFYNASDQGAEKFDRATSTISTGAGYQIFADTTGRSFGQAVDVGDNKIPSVGGTFAAKGVWLGCANFEEGISPHGALFARTSIKYCLGDYDSLVFPTVSGGSHLRYPGVDVSTAGNYVSSIIDWDQSLPVSTAIVVQTSLDGENWSTATKGAAVTGLAGSLAGVIVYVRVELQTSDSSVTPTFSNLSLSVTGDNPPLTSTPTDYFEKGHLTWTSGNNNGISMEVKEFNPTTKVVTLFLDMPFDLSVDDTFNIWPGCKKRITEDCAGKFSNAVNFGGQPDVPGEDVIRAFPDAR